MAGLVYRDVSHFARSKLRCAVRTPRAARDFGDEISLSHRSVVASGASGRAAHEELDVGTRQAEAEFGQRADVDIICRVPAVGSMSRQVVLVNLRKAIDVRQ